MSANALAIATESRRGVTYTPSLSSRRRSAVSSCLCTDNTICKHNGSAQHECFHAPLLYNIVRKIISIEANEREQHGHMLKETSLNYQREEESVLLTILSFTQPTSMLQKMRGTRLATGPPMLSIGALKNCTTTTQPSTTAVRIEAT